MPNWVREVRQGVQLPPAPFQQTACSCIKLVTSHHPDQRKTISNPICTFAILRRKMYAVAQVKQNQSISINRQITQVGRESLHKSGARVYVNSK
jgi:hypothetical protein